MANTQETIRLLESRRYRAMCEADAKTLEELLADSLVYTHSYGGADSKASYLDGIRSKKWQYRAVERPIEDIQVHGDCAVVTGQVRIELLSDGKPKKLNSRFTNVWVKGGQGWQMVAWQSTPLPA
ncbi:MAG TPA: nuclear transport factor 2 family protein [Burkholderiales bacterium]|jgi:ketosteroid isomerase-like protein|nr:nuclear transport factor 2 family protein [Burkholderiales bacterium]